MISVEEALARVLDRVSVLEPETKRVLDAQGQVLAEDVVATYSIPPYDNSAMDGYAVRAEDTRGASEQTPVRLTVVGDLAAGYVSDRPVTKGTAIRIMTGAPLPPGADAVVQFENTDERMGDKQGSQRKTVTIYREASPRLNVREAGEDVRQGQTVLKRGAVLRAGEIGVLASLGRRDVSVIRRPKVAVLSTGDELVEIDAPLQPGKIRNSNSYSVASLVLKYGGIPIMLGIARDELNEVVGRLRQAADADLLITSGGVSVGDFDVVKDALTAEGEVTFWQVRMKPGKPLAFGNIRGIPHLGLPGNPVSAMISFEQFARPAILKMLGKTVFKKPEVKAIVHGEARNKDGRRQFLRAYVERRGGEWHASLTGPQGSGILMSMALANGLVIVPEDVPAIRTGDLVTVQMLDWPEDVTCE